VLVILNRGHLPQPPTRADDPRTQAARDIPVSKSHSRLTANVPDTTQRESPGLPLPLTKALSSPRDQPSNINLVDPSSSAERPFLSTPHDTVTLARENGETTDSASDGTTNKEGVCMP
jgi:hypothetical protein